jgi:hypothetical protein
MRTTVNQPVLRASNARFITPKERPITKATATSVELCPDYTLQIKSYTDQRTQKVIANFIGDPILLTNFYELLGMLPFEIEDIQKNVQSKNVRMALIETDDLIEKLITWRVKLSHKLSI